MTPDKNTADVDFSPFGFNSSSPSQATFGKSIDIVKFVLSIWKPLALGLILGTMVGIGVYLMLGPVYEANTQVLVSQKARVPINDGAASTYGDRGDHVELIKTDLIIERAFVSHGLKDIPGLANAYDPIKEVKEGLSINRSSGLETSFDNILDISYVHPDKVIAKAVVQAMVGSYTDYLQDTRDENTKQVHQLLLEKQKERRKEIDELEDHYDEFRKNAPVYLNSSPVVTINGMPAPGQSRFEAELTSLEKAQNENLRKEASLQAKLATLDRLVASNTSREVLEFWVMHSLSSGTAGEGKGGGGGGAAALQGPPAKGQLDQQLMTARLLQQNLLTTLGAKHIAVRNVDKQILTILDFYRQQGLTPPSIKVSDQPISNMTANLGMDLIAVYRQTILGQLEEIKFDDTKLKLLHKDAEDRAKLAEMSEIEDQNLKDTIALKKKQEQSLFEEIAAFDVSNEQSGYRLKQIAQVRVDRSIKRVLKLVGTFGMMGVVMVFCLAYAREWFDTSLQTLKEVREYTNCQVLGAVPAFASSTDADRMAKQTGISSAICYYHRPGSEEAEAYRSVRTTLFHSMVAGEQIIQVSSPEPGDGKSTTAANMAVAMAQSGKSVLLVDCDLRRPTQHFLFGMSQEIGLTDVLLKEIEWGNAVRPTPVGALSLMTAGLCPENPAELLSTSVLPQFLRQARNQYDIILLDSPPVLAVSDPSIVAPHADGMILVVGMNKNKRPTILRTKETLDAHGVKLYGTVANQFDRDEASDSGYNYQEYAKYYSPEQSAPVPPVPKPTQIGEFS